MDRFNPEAVEAYPALKLFGFTGHDSFEGPCRRVLSMVASGIEFTELTPAQRATLAVWVKALGSCPPFRVGIFHHQPVVESISGDAVRVRSREVADYVAENEGDDATRSLARRLAPTVTRDCGAAELAVLTERVYSDMVPTFDGPEDRGARPRDRYDEMAEAVPETWLLDD